MHCAPHLSISSDLIQMNDQTNFTSFIFELNRVYSSSFSFLLPPRMANALRVRVYMKYGFFFYGTVTSRLFAFIAIPLCATANQFIDHLVFARLVLIHQISVHNTNATLWRLQCDININFRWTIASMPSLPLWAPRQITPKL